MQVRVPENRSTELDSSTAGAGPAGVRTEESFTNSSIRASQPAEEEPYYVVGLWRSFVAIVTWLRNPGGEGPKT